MKLGSLIVEVADAPLVDDPRHGGKRRDWSTVTWRPIGGCLLQPLTGDEMGEGREFTATHVKLFTPHGADVSATSRVRIESNIYDVDGEPGVWNDATGRGMYVVILLKMLAG